MPFGDPLGIPTLILSPGILSIIIDNIVFSKILYKWNYAECTLFCLAPFTWDNYFEVHNVSCISTVQLLLLLLLQNSIPFRGYTRFIHSSIDEHFACFRFLATTNKGAMNICLQLFEWIYAFIFHV